MSTERNLVIEKDSLAYDVYTLLWKHEYQSTQYSFKLSNTIVFKNYEPVVWAFSNSNNQVKKKTAEILTYDNIKKLFSSVNNVSGIAATYIYEVGDKLVIKYLKCDEIGPFIDDKNSRHPEGILQQFIDPNTQRNSVIRAIWSPQTCIMTKQTNKQNIYNQQLDINERSCTFEGPPQFSETFSLKGKICTRVKQCLNEIHSNIILATDGNNRNLKKLACHFKLDESENIYFLWSNTLRTEPKSNSAVLKSRSYTSKQFQSINLNQKPAAYSTLDKEITIEKKKVQSQSGQLALNKYEIECHQCNQKKVRETFIQIQYKILIEHQLVLDELGINEKIINIPKSIEQYKSKTIKTTKKYFNIPRVLQIIHPNLKYPTFACIKDNPSFYNRTAQVCSSCYFEIIGKVSKTNGQGGIQIIKRSISVGNSRTQRPLNSSREASSEQQYMNPIRLISARERQRKYEQEQKQQQQLSSPQKFIEDDSECSKPTVFVKGMEKISVGVQSQIGFSSANNTQSQSINTTQMVSSMNNTIRQRSHYSAQSELNLHQNLKNNRDLQQSQSFYNSNGFTMKKTFSAYTCFEEGMDVPQKSQVQSSPFQNSEVDKYSTIYSSSERQSWKDVNHSIKQDQENSSVKMISVKGFVQSQQQLLQSQSSQKSDQKVNVEDITLFNLVKPFNEEGNSAAVVPGNQQNQKIPEYSNTPTFQFVKGNGANNKNEADNFKQIIEQHQIPYQYRLSFGNQQALFKNEKEQSIFSEQRKNKKIEQYNQKVSTFLQEQVEKQKKNDDKDIKIIINDGQIDSQFSYSGGKIVHKKKNSIPRSDGYMSNSSKGERYDIQSEKAQSAQKINQRDSQCSQKELPIIEQILLQQQLLQRNYQQKEQDKANQEPVNEQQNEIETFQDSVLTSEAENSEKKEKKRKIIILKNNFTECISSQGQIKNNQSEANLPVKMLNNQNHIPIKKERGLFYVKKVQSKEKLNSKKIIDKSEDGYDSDNSKKM